MQRTGAALLLLALCCLAWTPAQIQAQGLLVMDIDNVEATGLGPFMFNFAGTDVYAYTRFDWNTDPIRPLSTSTPVSENLVLLDGTDGVTATSDDFVLHAFEHVVFDNDNQGDRRTYIGGVIEILLDLDLKVRLHQCRFTAEVNYVTQVTEGSGWCSMDADASDPDWYDEFDLHGTGQVRLDYGSISQVVQGGYGNYDFIATFETPAFQEHLAGLALTTTGDEIADTLDFAQQGVQLAFSQATPGGPDADLQEVVVSRVDTSAVGTPPEGIESVVPGRFWRLGTTLEAFTADLEFDLSGFTGIVDPAGLRLLRRAHPDSAWAVWTDFALLGGGTRLRAHGVTSFSDWAVGAQPGALPVELTAFEVHADGDAAVLTWQTASETNNAGFELQGALADAAAWHVYDFVAGRGTTTEAQHYRHRIAGLAPGTYRFRLRQIDHDGAATYGPVVEASVGVPHRATLSPPSPSPFTTRTAMTLTVPRSQHVHVALYDLLGRRAAALFDGVVAAGDAQPIALEAGDLPGGVYFVRVEGETFVQTRRVVLLR